MDTFDISVKEILGQHFESKVVKDDKNKVGLKSKKRRSKLDTTLLLGSFGLESLDKELSKFVFKGKGNEEDDLIRLIDKYRIWCQQMMGMMTFSDCIEKIEELGHKREVKNALKKYRDDLGFQSLSNEYVMDNKSDNENAKEASLDFPIYNEEIDFEYDDKDFNDEMENVEILPPEIKNQSMELSEEKLLQIEENRRRARERLKITMSNMTAEERASVSVFYSDSLE